MDSFLIQRHAIFHLSGPSRRSRSFSNLWRAGAVSNLAGSETLLVKMNTSYSQLFLSLYEGPLH